MCMLIVAGLHVIRFFVDNDSKLIMIIPMTVLGFLLIVVAVVWVIHRSEKFLLLNVPDKLMWDFGVGGSFLACYSFMI